jgi:hypothetical protein
LRISLKEGLGGERRPKDRVALLISLMYNTYTLHMFGSSQESNNLKWEDTSKIQTKKAPYLSYNPKQNEHRSRLGSSEHRSRVGCSVDSFFQPEGHNCTHLEGQLR